MKLKSIKDTLPSKPSELIYLQIRCLNKVIVNKRYRGCEFNDKQAKYFKKVVPNNCYLLRSPSDNYLFHWKNGIDNIMEVSWEGSLSLALNISKDQSVTFDDLKPSIQNKIKALTYFRSGEVNKGLKLLGIPVKSIPYTFRLDTNSLPKYMSSNKLKLFYSKITNLINEELDLVTVIGSNLEPGEYISIKEMEKMADSFSKLGM